MKLLASYTDEDPPALVLSDLETREIIHTIEPTDDARRSLTHQAQAWAKQHAHTIADWDRSNITNGECAPHHDDRR